MKKISMKQNISALNKLSKRVPKSINEAINFEGFDDNEEMGMDDEPMNEPTDDNTPMGRSGIEEGIDVENFISNMRKSSLKIMAKLSDDPDSAVYQFAKKIFQLADKAHEDEKEGKDINGQPKQQVVQRNV